MGMAGRKHSEETKALMRKRKEGRYKGEENSRWKGGRIKRRAKGEKPYWYVLAPNHPKVGKNRYIPEHRLVMEKHLGRILETWEHVHHKNGDSLDNRLENLEVLINKNHYGTVRCPCCLREFFIK